MRGKNVEREARDVGKPVIFRRQSSDFWDAFEVQKTALEVSALAFDGGLKGEAARMATSVFLLFGRGMKSHQSVFDNLGIQNAISFHTTVPDQNKSGTPLIAMSLVQYRINEWVVELNTRGRQGILTGRSLKFDEWWNEIVLSDSSGKDLSRENIIRILRDKNGGAHYDASITDPLIVAALRGEITGLFCQSQNGQRIPVPHALETTMRQIAEEVRTTIRYLHLSHDPRFQSATP